MAFSFTTRHTGLSVVPIFGALTTHKSDIARFPEKLFPGAGTTVMEGRRSETESDAPESEYSGITLKVHGAAPGCHVSCISTSGSQVRASFLATDLDGSGDHVALTTFHEAGCGVSGAGVLVLHQHQE